MIPSLMQQQPQANATGAGMSTSSMQAMMEKARMFSDGELADILMGKSMAIPQFVAMTEAMGRKQLRTAVEGQQAGQQANQPTVKDQLMSEEERAATQEQAMAQPSPAETQGLAALPAPNMEPTEKAMAGGGIIAFSDRGLVDLDALNAQAKPNDAVKNAWLEQNKNITPSPTTPSFLDTLPQRLAEKRSSATDMAIAKAEEDAAAQDKAAGVKPAVNELALPTGIQTIANKDDLNAINKRIAPKAPPVDPSLAKKVADENPKEPPKAPRADPFADMGSSKEDLDKKVQSEKDFAAGQYLMSIGQAMMSVPNLGMALAKGNELGLPGLVASRKTINDLEKNQKDYNFQLAKAREAREQGNEELAIKHEELAQKVIYQTGVLAVENRKAGAEELRAGAYASQVGSKEDMADQRRETSIMNIAKGLLEKNMKYNMPNTKPEERQAMEQAAINSAVNMYNNAKTATKGSAGFKLLGVEQQG